MANHFPKQKRGFYEKSSQLSNVIQNLRSYQLATGDVHVSSTKLAQARDVFGTDEGRAYASLVKGTVGKQSESIDQPKQHRKRKRRRRPRKDQQTTSSPTVSKPPNKRQTSSSALSMLSTYSDSDDSDKYEVPPAIMNMFSENTLKEKHSAQDEVSVSKVGYFEAGSSSDSNEVSTRSSHHKDKAISTQSEPLAAAPTVPLSSYVCWKCSNVGHLPQDCTVSVGQKSSKVKLPSEVRTYFDQCHKIKQRKADRCAECGIHSNLASCLECGIVLCDGRGHLASHLSEHPTHNTLYSHKLRRMLKCCKRSCDVVNVYDLLMCSVCLGKAFTQHYSMVSATWSKSGLRSIPNALCCDEHFQWHRMNCPNAAEEHFVSMETLQEHCRPNGLISEFFL